MKSLKFILFILLIVLLAISCNSKEQSINHLELEQVSYHHNENIYLAKISNPPKSRIIESKGSKYGIDTPPKWFEFAISGEAHKASKLYPGKIPIITSFISEDLWVAKMEAFQQVVFQVAIMIGHATLRSTNLVYSDGNFDYEDSFSIDGLVKEDDWWALVQDPYGKKEYRYYAIYLMDKE